MSDNPIKVEKIKVRLYNCHVAYINKRLIHELEHQCQVIDFNSWLRQQIYQDFNLRLRQASDLEVLKDLLIQNYYDNAGDWLNEKIRSNLKKSNGQLPNEMSH